MAEADAEEKNGQTDNPGNPGDGGEEDLSGANSRQGFLDAVAKLHGQDRSSLLVEKKLFGGKRPSL